MSASKPQILNCYKPGNTSLGESQRREKIRAHGTANSGGEEGRPASRCAPRFPGNCPGDFPANCPVWLQRPRVLPRKGARGPVGATESAPQRTQHPSIAPTGAAEEGSALRPGLPTPRPLCGGPWSPAQPSPRPGLGGGTLWPHPGCGPPLRVGILVFSLPSRQRPALPGKPHSTLTQLSSAPLAGRSETRGTLQVDRTMCED